MLKKSLLVVHVCIWDHPLSVVEQIELTFFYLRVKYVYKMLIKIKIEVFV